MTTTTTYAVAGMTCQHCVTAVNEEIGVVPGVIGVTIELRPAEHSLVSVTSTEPLSEPAIAAAIDEAGYELVER